ncbi:hypothetical protein PR048_023035 [Dryococelus australis]|uniref:Uncharacterized protein n=1 Tax=Dryococelus australis TaxID=614101 RepID=A0ABQ9GSZ7_9NEOP|nr:hypothetical protein PR048_023035 [Dryococelus australis]
MKLLTRRFLDHWNSLNIRESLASRATLIDSWMIPERRGTTAAIYESASASLCAVKSGTDLRDCGLDASCEPMRVKLGENGVASGCKGKREREIPEETRRPAASSATIPTYENSGVTWLGVEPGSPWWEVSSLTAQTQRPRLTMRVDWRGEIWVALNIEVLRADEGEVRRMWSGAGMQGRGKREIPEKADEQHYPARFPHAKIRDRPRQDSSPVSLGLEARSLTTAPPRPLHCNDINILSLERCLLWEGAAPRQQVACGPWGMRGKLFGLNDGGGGRGSPSLNTTPPFATHASSAGRMKLRGSWTKLLRAFDGTRRGVIGVPTTGSARGLADPDAVFQLEERSSAGMQFREKRQIPEKTRQPAASSGKIPTCGNSGVTRRGIKPCSPWWEVSSLTTQPLRP